jgi:5'-nucleotidase/UDP-sugar diphosphatase
LSGRAAETLCLERIPGQGRSALCDVAATQANGGDIQQLVTQAFLERSFEADIALQNSGGRAHRHPDGRDHDRKPRSSCCRSRTPW